MGEIATGLYCLNCKKYYSDDQIGFSELWNTQLCSKCNFPLLSQDDTEELMKVFKIDLNE